MQTIYQIYIDESCHLENDRHPVMCLGYTKVEYSKYSKIKQEILALKKKHHTPTELKWNKLSSSRLPLYKALIDLFFDSSITFRCILVKYKEHLDHNAFNKGDHNSFYYKLVYYLLNTQTNQVIEGGFRVFLDIKDTRGSERLRKIREVMNNAYYGNSPFIHFQHIHSAENVFLQMADLMIGAVTYKSRGEHNKASASKVKKEIVAYLEERSGYSLNEGTPPWEEKFNIFDHQPRAKH